MDHLHSATFAFSLCIHMRDSTHDCKLSFKMCADWRIRSSIGLRQQRFQVHRHGWQRQSGFGIRGRKGETFRSHLRRFPFMFWTFLKLTFSESFFLISRQHSQLGLLPFHRRLQRSIGSVGHKNDQRVHDPQLAGAHRQPGQAQPMGSGFCLGALLLQGRSESRCWFSRIRRPEEDAGRGQDYWWGEEDWVF